MSTRGRAPWYQSDSKPLIIGVTGGSASGKTSVCEAIVSKLNVPWVGLLSMDRYYKVLEEDEIEIAHRGAYNFDHPDAFDIDRLYDDVMLLKQGKAVDVPVYDFCTHSRCEQTDRMYGVDVVIVEGILLFYAPKVRELLDLKIYVDTDNDLRLARRIRRDIIERGRSVDNVLAQYQRTVKPSFDQFIQPTKRYADLIIPWNDNNFIAVNILTQHISTLLEKKQQATLMLPSQQQKLKKQKVDIQQSYEAAAAAAGDTNNMSANADADAPISAKKSLPVLMNPTEAQHRLETDHDPQIFPQTGVVIMEDIAAQEEQEAKLRRAQIKRQQQHDAQHPTTTVDVVSIHTDIYKKGFDSFDLSRTGSEQDQQEQQPQTQNIPESTLPPTTQATTTTTTQQVDLTLPTPDITPQPSPTTKATLYQGDSNKISELRELYQDSFVRHNNAALGSVSEDKDARVTRTTALYPKNFPSNLLVLPPTKALTALHTTLRNINSTIYEFRFAMSRLVRIICTEAMNLLPYQEKTVSSSSNKKFFGLDYASTDHVVAVSIVRAGEAFESSAREVIKDIAIGKVVIQHDRDKSAGPRLYYANLPIVNDPTCKILLFDGVLATGAAVIMAIHVLLDHGAKPENIIFCCTTATPEGIYNVSSMFPEICIVTSALENGLDDDSFCIPGVGAIGELYHCGPYVEPSAFARIQNNEMSKNMLTPPVKPLSELDENLPSFNLK